MKVTLTRLFDFLGQALVCSVAIPSRVDVARVLAAALAALALAFAVESHAITLKRTGDRIELSGPIEPGDSKKFSAFVEAEKRQVRPTLHEGDGFEWTVSLDSPGGSLLDGIEIGRHLQEFRFETRVERGKACYSACAIAFLGGMRQYATGIGPWREIEFGATLGFHGYKSEINKVVILNEAFDVARAMNGLVLEYAAQMKKIDLGFLSELLNVPASKMRLIRSPSDFQKLGIDLVDPPKRPANSGYNACLNVVNRMRPSFDGFEDDDRLHKKPHSVRDPAELLERMLDQRFDKVLPADQRKRELLARLPVEQALEFLTDDHIHLSNTTFPVDFYELGRGAGFYYDGCYVLYSSDGGATSILVSNMGSNVYTYHSPLDLHPPDVPLWR